MNRQINNNKTIYFFCVYMFNKHLCTFGARVSTSQTNAWLIAGQPDDDDVHVLLTQKTITLDDVSTAEPHQVPDLHGIGMMR